MNRTMRRVIMDRRMRDRVYHRGGNDYGHGRYEGEFRGDYAR